jgi:uncharacterized iron-regulated membrane protein
LRRAVFWLHLALGVTAGLVVLVMSVTGTLLAFERQITAWAEADVRRVAPPPDGVRLPVAEIVRRSQGAMPEAAPSGVTLWSDPGHAAAIAFGREGVVYVNPYTGAVTGQGSRAMRGFFRGVTDWHRWLGTSGDARSVGRGVTGASNLAFLAIVLTGPVLWWPRDWSWRHVRSVVLFQRTASGRARDFNWHNVTGIWMAVPLLVIVASGVVISYRWASDGIYRLAGETPPAPPAAAPAAPREARAGRTAGPQVAPEELAALDPLWARAEGQVAGWKSISARLGGAAAGPAAFTIDRGDGGRPQLRAQLTLDRKTGEVVRFDPYAQQSPARRVRTWLRFAHTGEALGIAGQAVAALASAGGALLVWTGLSLALRRLRAWKARSPAPSAEPFDPRLEEAR